MAVFFSSGFPFSFQPVSLPGKATLPTVKGGSSVRLVGHVWVELTEWGGSGPLNFSPDNWALGDGGGFQLGGPVDSSDHGAILEEV